MKEFYKNKMDFHHQQWELSFESSKEKAAAFHMQEYTNYKEMLDSLKSITQIDGQFCLKLDNKKNIHLDLSYEINELEKDIFFIARATPPILPEWEVSTRMIFILLSTGGSSLLKKA